MRGIGDWRGLWIIGLARESGNGERSFTLHRQWEIPAFLYCINRVIKGIRLLYRLDINWEI